MPNRHKNHITETKSVKIFLQMMPDHWVVRDLSERDYGIDLLVEIFEQNGDATGITFCVQLKGTKDKSIGSKSLKKGFLLYTYEVPVPFFLFYISVNKDKARFTHLQKYVEVHKDSIEKTKTHSVNFPKKNKLEIGKDNGNSLAKIEKIAYQLKYKLEGIKFCSEFLHAQRHIEAMQSGGMDKKQENLEFVKSKFEKFKELRTLLKYNQSQVSEDSFDLIMSKLNLQYIDEITEDLTAYHNVCLLNGTFLDDDALNDFSAEMTGDVLY